jgi:hypothetical protein
LEWECRYIRLRDGNPRQSRIYNQGFERQEGEKLLQKSFPVLVMELQELVELRDIKNIEEKLVEFGKQLAEFLKESQLPK